MSWNKVADVGFPKLGELDEGCYSHKSIDCLCAVLKYDGTIASYVYSYEKIRLRKGVVERWKTYRYDSIVQDPENIIAWIPIPQYAPTRGRLIDADALKKAIPETRVDTFENCRNCGTLTKDDIVYIIDSMPTIEV